MKQIIAKQLDKGTWSSITFGRYLPKGRARLSAIIQPHCLKPHRLLNSELLKWHWMRKVFSFSITLVTDPFTGFLATGGCGFPGKILWKLPCFGKVGRVPLHSYAWDVGGPPTHLPIMLRNNDRSESTPFELHRLEPSPKTPTQKGPSTVFFPAPPLITMDDYWNSHTMVLRSSRFVGIKHAVVWVWFLKPGPKKAHHSSWLPSHWFQPSTGGGQIQRGISASLQTSRTGIQICWQGHPLKSLTSSDAPWSLKTLWLPTSDFRRDIFVNFFNPLEGLRVTRAWRMSRQETLEGRQGCHMKSSIICVYGYIRVCMCSCKYTCKIIYIYKYIFIYLLIYLFIYLSIYLFMYLFIYSFNHLFIYYLFIFMLNGRACDHI